MPALVTAWHAASVFAWEHSVIATHFLFTTVQSSAETMPHVTAVASAQVVGLSMHMPGLTLTSLDRKALIFSLLYTGRFQ
jgi:hypothetical protein